MEISHFFTKAVGVTFKNDNGTSRQKAIRESRPGERLRLITGTNPQFPDSIALIKRNGKQIGNLEADLAKDLVGRMRRSQRFVCLITDVTGGERGKENYGANLAIIQLPPNADDRQAEAYIKKNLGELVRTKEERRGCGCKTLLLSLLLIAILLVLGAIYAGRSR